eukprot:GEMP01056999.1.p1 GENE.GEMP01056999.1~~GEMP01056999.1.p1  ORF type:complete len:324 (+),score=66.26 GEMP01056999.1:112-1083(+)
MLAPAQILQTLTHRIIRCGLIADVQYADVEDGTDFCGHEIRYFRNALNVARNAGSFFREQNVDFMINLGDIIDGRNKETEMQTEALRRVLEPFAGLPRYDLIGNHELYCWDRDTLPSILHCTKEESFYFAINFPKWVFVFLDPYDVSMLGRPQNHPKTLHARTILEKYNPTALGCSGNWFEGLSPPFFKYVPYNGALGAEQISWLDGVLTTAQDNDDTVLLFTHVPLCQPEDRQRTMVWDSEEALNVISKYDNVMAIFAGHSHRGSYLVENGIHHVTLPAPLLCAPGEEAYAVLEATDDEEGPVVKLTGVGLIESLQLRRKKT